MMGTKDRDFALLPPVSLEELVPSDHFYRHLERTLDLGFVRDLVRDAYADIGRPSIDPVVFFKLQLVLFFEGLRSERQLMQVVADRLSLRWYLGYDLTEPLPDHSSLTRIRERYGLESFRRFFESIVEQCLAARLVWGQELYIDATKVTANASLNSLQPRFAVEAHVARLFAEGGDGDEGDGSGGPDEANEGDEPAPWLVARTEAARQTVAKPAAHHDWIGQAGRPNRNVRSGTYQRTADFRIGHSMCDPYMYIYVNRWYGAGQGDATAMAKEPLTITIDPDSELGRALNETNGEPVVLVRSGTRFRVTRDLDDPWANYDPERVRAGLRKFAGMLSPEEGERIKETIYRGREEGTRPIDRP